MNRIGEKTKRSLSFPGQEKDKLLRFISNVFYV